MPSREEIAATVAKELSKDPKWGWTAGQWLKFVRKDSEDYAETLWDALIDAKVAQQEQWDKLSGEIHILERQLEESRDQARYKSEQLVIDLARELYDRFVMGGWEPKDAYPQIRAMLADAKVELAEREQPSTVETRFAEFDDAEHPFRKWWEEHGQYMMSGGGRRESIWAARGWIAREQLLLGKDVTGDSMHESRDDSELRVKELSEALSKIHRWLVCAPIASTEDFMSGVVDMELTARAVLSEG